MAAVRDSSIDIARGLGVALVVLGHNQIVLRHGEGGDLFTLIYAFHVPLFFFLSGLFVRPADAIAAFAGSKAESLLKPYFVVLFGVGIVLALNKIRQGQFSADWLLGYAQGVFYGVGATIEWNPLWFLPCLFLVSLLGFLVVKYGRSPAVIAMAAVVALVLGVILLERSVPLPWSADLVPLCLAFFLAGYGLRQRVVAMQFSPVWLALLVLAFAGLNWQSAAVVDLNHRVYEAPLLSTPRAFVGIFICLQLSCLLARYRLPAEGLAYIGSGSLFILIFHGVCQGQVAHTAGRLLGNPTAGHVLGFVAGIVVPLLLLALASRLKLLAILLLPRPRRTPARAG
jgi:fucose 4-O-acetylase-like acetyltransferase